MYPTIPWYRLPEAHNALCKGEGDVSCGFIDTYRQMKKSSLGINNFLGAAG